jgi:hypothetical protein
LTNIAVDLSSGAKGSAKNALEQDSVGPNRK